jgi:hypothetical protein
MRKALIVVSSVLFLSIGLASGESQIQRTMVEELMMLTKVEQSMAAARTEMEQFAVRLLDSMDIPDDQKDRFAKYHKRLMDFVNEEMSWERIKEDVMDVYASVFTQEELAGLITFYRTPFGQALVTKTPELMTQMMAIMQSRMHSLMPRIKHMAEDALEELLAEGEFRSENE